MNNHLSPTYQNLFGSLWVCWYVKSNCYSVIEDDFKTLLDLYFKSDSVDQFENLLGSLGLDLGSYKQVQQNIETYLHNCNTIQDIAKSTTSDLFNSTKRNIHKQYSVKGKLISIFYDSELVEKTIHPAIAHFATKTSADSEVIFDVYLHNDLLWLFRNKKMITSVPKREYHLLQGKFFMQLLSVIYGKDETEWIGTFHGSTIANGTTSILFIGESGKGKSTLCALLAANGFELVADDVSPMLAENSKIYHNPSALSTKEGAFKVLSPVIEGFDDLPTTFFNTHKGQLKYIPFSRPRKDGYSCKAIIEVNYSENSKTTLEPISIKKILETLVPESWLSSNPDHARLFLSWLQPLRMYRLTYSDTVSVVNEIDKLFSALND